MENPFLLFFLDEAQAVNGWVAWQVHNISVPTLSCVMHHRTVKHLCRWREIVQPGTPDTTLRTHTAQPLARVSHGALWALV